MWILKLEIPYRKGVMLCDICRKYKVTCIGYPLAAHETKQGTNLVVSGYMVGDEINAAVKEAKKSKYVINLEQQGEFITAELKHLKIMKLLFQSGTFFTRPIIMDYNGISTLEIACWRRLPLQMIAIASKLVSAKILKLKKKRIKNVQTISIHPTLSKQQKKCFQLAVQHKYYDYPRQITLKELAKIARLSYSTFQFHLQNAEKKLFPHVVSQI